MAATEHLVIIGASARAAAGSALRAGLRPWCADLFADADLAARCPVRRVAPCEYPRGFLRVMDEAPPGPWLYTGGLENRRGLVHVLTRRRPLWGNDAAVLRKARSPRFMQSLLRKAGLPALSVLPGTTTSAPARGRWLIKPLRGAGGTGVRFWMPGDPDARPGASVYFQEFTEGEPGSAVFVGDGEAARLLGATRQLVGADWLHAAPFHYCGSVGPFALAPQTRATLEQVGAVLTRGCRLRGLFGVDFVLQGEVPWPVEVNPRYPASVEVLEYARGVPALALHRRVFDPSAPPPALAAGARAEGAVGKAIVFARRPLAFPAAGPWTAGLVRPPALEDLPAFADVPHAGEAVPAGKPVLTVLARAATLAACEEELCRASREVDHALDRSADGP